MPWMSAEDRRDLRACAFTKRFGPFCEYFELEYLNNLEKYPLDSFMAAIPQVIHDASGLDATALSQGKALVKAELEKQLHISPYYEKLRRLYNLLKKVQASERAYLAKRRAQKKEREDLHSKHDEERKEEEKQREKIQDVIDTLQEQIEKLRYDKFALQWFLHYERGLIQDEIDKLEEQREKLKDKKRKLKEQHRTNKNGRRNETLQLFERQKRD